MGEVVRNFWNNFWKILELVPKPDDKKWDFKGIARKVFGEGEDVTKTCVISFLITVDRLVVKITYVLY